jgi:hypothetical protein
MKRLQNILIITNLSVVLTFCGQTNTSQRLDKTSSQNQNDSKYKGIISDSTNKLTDKVEDLEVEYTVWDCTCPNWILTKDKENNDTIKNYLGLHFYIEPADKSLELPIYFDPLRHKLKLTGQFHIREDCPQGTVETEKHMPQARVFRYSKIEVIDNPNFRPDSKVETLTLIYNAIACTCAQWSETRFSNETYKKKYFTSVQRS